MDMNETTERLVSLETKLETNLEFIKEQLSEIKTGQDRLQDSIKTIERDHSEHKGILIGAKWMIGVTLLVLAACGGVAGAVVSHLLK